MITGYVPGGFDMLHVGHLNILTEAAKRCDHLIAGVATDAEQVLITAAVGADVPDFPSARRFRVRGGVVEPVKELEVADD